MGSSNLLFTKRFHTTILALLLFHTSICAAGLGSCLKAVTELTSRPAELFDLYQREICDRGCRPTVTHWDLWTRNHTYVPAIRSVTRALDVPEREADLIRIGDEAAKRIREHCGEIIADKNVCHDGETLAAFGTCFKKQFVKVVMKNAFKLLPLLSEEKCRVQLEFVKDERLWKEIIPGNMREYAASCNTLDEQRVVRVESGNSPLLTRPTEDVVHTEL